ncbi:DDT domain-containing protein PTM [Vitis vinifera]|uniref:DDT domain-containing protein PTM n=1 Tax=Vitis vinifera TaxID=29760 RepID=A0A438KFW7_VITVI|nr:DDT domain-containing protein PTM [Vitis vinifera]
METVVTRSERRGRKRRRIDVQTVAVDGQAGDETKRARSNVLVGQYVLKEFEGNGIFLGKIMYYDGGLYRVDYEDGDCEDLESKKNISAMKLVESGNGVERVEASLVSDLSDVPIHEVDSVELDGEADSSSDSCEYARDREFGSDAETPMVPPPQLPPSSGNIGVPEERHLEALSSSGLELASKCLWCIDWSLVDTLTWPVYLVQYLTIMGYTKGLELKGFYADVLDREYYTLSAGRKLIILKILCDDVLDSEELRAEIDMREESEIGIDPDSVTNFPPENGPRRVHPRYSKTSACKDQEAMQIIAESHETKLSRNSNSLGFKTTELDVNAADDQDVNGDECRLCGMDGTLLCCDGCPSVYHSRCIGVSKMFIPDGPWFCPECTIDKIGPTITVGTSLRGAEVFGIDAFEQVYLGTCNHLLVLKASIDAETCVRYYHQNDILKVIQVLYSSEQYAALYSGICKAILKYWEIKENVLLVPEIVEMDPTLANKKDGATIRPLSLPPPGIVNQKVLDTVVEGENCLSSITESSGMDFATCLSGNSNSSNSGYMTGVCFPENLSSQSKSGNLRIVGRVKRNTVDDCTYMGAFFKSYAYINNYAHGDFAASAAANLAILSSEENRVSEVQASSNPRKVLSANISLQGEMWLVSFLQASVSSKRGCLLNSAALNAIKGAMKILAGIRPLKNVEGNLPSIATYILYMEESLSGLVVGPFLSATCRKQWRRRVEQASTYSVIKALLLEEGTSCLCCVCHEWWCGDDALSLSFPSLFAWRPQRGVSGREIPFLLARKRVVTNMEDRIRWKVAKDDSSFSGCKSREDAKGLSLVKGWEGKRDHLVRWDAMCKSRVKGGLGIGKIPLRNRALLGKWLWRFPRESTTLWH